MKIQVVATRTDTGATTKLMTKNNESSKNYASWNDALKEAEWSARLEMCQWRRETLDKESIWEEARSTSLSKW
jgi:hypothetical protein